MVALQLSRWEFYRAHIAGCGMDRFGPLMNCRKFSHLVWRAISCSTVEARKLPPWQRRGVCSPNVRDRTTHHGSANTNTLPEVPGFNSGVTRRVEFPTREAPVVTATYCL